MKQVSKLGLLVACAGLISTLSCNSRRTDKDKDSVYTTDAAGNPDTTAMAPGSAAFSKTLTFRQYSFTVNQEGKGALRRLTITGKDSVNKLDELNEPMEGSIYYAQATDINNDGKPEIFCFAKGSDSAGYAKVYAYAFEGRKGRQIQLPELSGEQATGYMGHDSVYIEDKYLVRQFPIYKNDSIPSGSMKTIRYTLRPGTDGYRLEQVQ